MQNNNGIPPLRLSIAKHRHLHMYVYTAHYWTYVSIPWSEQYHIIQKEHVNFSSIYNSTGCEYAIPFSRTRGADVETNPPLKKLGVFLKLLFLGVETHPLLKKEKRPCGFEFAILGHGSLTIDHFCDSTGRYIIITLICGNVHPCYW